MGRVAGYTLLLLAALAAVAAATTVNTSGRKLKQDYSGTNSGDWGSTSTTVDASGTTTTTDTPYYSGSYTYNAADGSSQTSGRKLSQDSSASGDWGSSSTTTGPDGSTQTTVDTPYYSGSYTYNAADNSYESVSDSPYYSGSASGSGRKLSQEGSTSSSSGDWGSTSTTTGADGTQTTVDTPYYSGSYTYNAADNSYEQQESNGRKLSQVDLSGVNYEGGSSGSWGSTSTTVKDGKAVTTTESPYYSGTATYDGK